MTIRIAMWSGPRNISTAMMRAWENRPDCSVVDEPFYACYLDETGLEHPCHEAILAAMPTQRKTVIEAMTQGEPSAVQYQKHMTHHMPEGCDLSWTRGLRNVFLIRDPAEVIASYLAKMPSVSEADIGITRQREMFEEITELTGTQPPVIDSNDVLRDPKTVLGKLCEAVDVPWLSEAMTEWPAGERDSDGVWADHWYHSVRDSTGFAPWQPRSISLDDQARALADAMRPHYEFMARHRLAA